jgi:hypothetical protein
LNNNGSYNTAVGPGAGSSITGGDNNICIGVGVVGSAADNHTTRIGQATGFNPQTACFIGGIANVNQGMAMPVFINSTTGQLGTSAPSSSRRFKNEIKPMDKASEAVLGLKPVTFHYKSDSTSTPQFGLIAEEVAAVNPDLIVRDDKGDIYSVRYDAVNAMLLNEFLKEHHQVQDLKAIVAAQQKQIEALTAGLQKVSAQIEVSKSTPRTVLNQ